MPRTPTAPGDSRAASTRDIAPRPSRFDVILAVALAALIQLEYRIDYAGAADVTPMHVLVGLLLALPLIWRRALPVPVGLGVVGVFVLQPEMLHPTPNTAGAALCLVVAVGALALYPRSWVTSLVCGITATALGVVGAWLDPDPKGLEAVSTSLTVMGVWVAGALLRRETERARRSEAAIITERLNAEALARDLVAQERGRIARELHDLVSHGMGVVVLQARGGRRVLETDAVRARLAFDEIERVSAACLREMRFLLDVLRLDDGAGPTDPPQPGLGRLDELVGEMRAAGMVVDVEVVGATTDLPAALDVSAYRILQEALTNVAQHAPGATAHVTVTRTAEAVALVVVDDGPRVEPPAPGHGLVGMRERTELFGGELVWDAPPSGGFVVRAALPLAVIAA